MPSFEDLIKFLVPTLVGAIIALTAPLINHWLGRRREREHVLFGKLTEKFMELEELIGFVTENLAGYKGFDSYKEEVFKALRTLDAKSGGFRRYQGVIQAIRDFMNSAGWIVSNGGHFPTREERDQVVGELLSHHRQLLEACDRVLGRKS